MKKIQTMFLVAFLALAFAMGSCKKEDSSTSNTATKTQLTKKWYYRSYLTKNTASGVVTTDKSNWGNTYMEFKSNNSFEDTWHFETSGTFTVNGKVATVAFPSSATTVKTYDFNINKLTDTELEITFIDRLETINIKMATTINPNFQK